MTITGSEARRDLFPLLKKVNDDHAPVRIASKQGNAVLMAESDYEAWIETMYLLSNPRTAAELMESVGELDVGRGAVHDLIDPEPAE